MGRSDEKRDNTLFYCYDYLVKNRLLRLDCCDLIVAIRLFLSTVHPYPYRAQLMHVIK
jgi:hypothetical protein